MSRRQRDIALEIDALDAEGRGTGRFEQRSVHVRGALPGERHSARVVRRRRGEWLALSNDWTASSPWRVPAPCPAFAYCGGCSQQHLDPAVQLEWKQAQLLAGLDAAGIQPRSVRDPVAGPLYHYRRKARLAARYLRGRDEVLVGFREALGSKIARADGCLVLVTALAELWRPLQALVMSLSVKDAIPQIEVAAGDSGRALILRHLAPLTPADRTQIACFEARHGVDIWLQHGGYDSLVPAGTHDGGLLQYRLDAFGLALAFHPVDFVQINAAINEKLVQTAIDALRLRPGDRVLDLFCGIGNFTLPIARRGAHCLGLEVDTRLVSRAQRNADRNGLADRVDFMGADLYGDFYTDCETDGKVDAGQRRAATAVGGARAARVLLDPPRSGAGAALALLRQPHVERVVYVSCDPTSFARDAAALSEHGFALTEVGAFDMFPQTAHVEMLGVFERQ